MADAVQLTVKRDEQKGKIWSYLRSKWFNYIKRKYFADILAQPRRK